MKASEFKTLLIESTIKQIEDISTDRGYTEPKIIQGELKAAYIERIAAQYVELEEAVEEEELFPEETVTPLSEEDRELLEAVTEFSTDTEVKDTDFDELDFGPANKSTELEEASDAAAEVAEIVMSKIKIVKHRIGRAHANLNNKPSEMARKAICSNIEQYDKELKALEGSLK